MQNTFKNSKVIKKYFYGLLLRYLSVYIRSENSVVEISQEGFPISTYLKHSKQLFLNQGCATVLPPDVSLRSFEQLAQEDPDYVILNGSIHYERNIQSFFYSLYDSCSHKTRIIVLYYSSAWRPLTHFASILGIRSRTPEQNWVDHKDIVNFLTLADFEPVLLESKILFPFYIPLLSNFINRYLAPLPFFRLFCMVNIMVARPLLKSKSKGLSVSIIVPARNESGNIENIIKRIPKMGPEDEIIFVEGHSKDDTWNEIERICKKYNSLPITCLKQTGSGKADAVRKGFACASKDILMILDADLSVPPEVLPAFYRALCEDKAEFLNGSRLVYSHEGKAMRFLNMVGNKIFAVAFSFLLGQKFKDTLCGTKVLSRENYEKIVLNRKYFGEFDPFGDFDLIFGASRLCLKIKEVPVRYYERAYGQTNIKRWRHGAILMRMLVYAAKKLKFI